MAVLRTPDSRFGALVEFPFAPRYAEIADPEMGTLRMHYVDEGPAVGGPVLLLHGQPTWCYLYRHVIAALVAGGHRAVAPDLVGFGRSDKPDDPRTYSFERHVGWMRSFLAATALEDITLVAMDWGGPIGLSALAAEPERFSRVVAVNTVLHTADPDLAGQLTWSNHGIEGGRVVLQEALVDYVLLCQRARHLDASVLVRFATARPASDEVLAAYDAPFPDEAHKAGMRQFPVLIPLTRNDPGAVIGRATLDVLRRWERPFLTAFGDADPATAGWDGVFQREVPGAAGQDHRIIAGAGHFLPEDHGDELARVIIDFVRA